jgi:Rieske Fe-S protein
MEPEVQATLDQSTGEGRREFLGATSAAMAAGLVGGYGVFGVMLGRFVYPAGQSNRAWLFVCQVNQLAEGEAIDFAAPSGQKIVVARQGAGVSADDFLALSSTCPHLGCRVHWEGANDRFFCPCHNGVFDRNGVATAGPPAAARQSLMRFPLKVENGLLFLEAPLTSVAATESTAADGVA